MFVPLMFDEMKLGSSSSSRIVIFSSLNVLKKHLCMILFGADALMQFSESISRSK